MGMIVHAGKHDRINTPVTLTVPAAALEGLCGDGIVGVRLDNGRVLPANCVCGSESCEVTFILPCLLKDEQVEVSFCKFQSCCRPVCAVNKTARGYDIIVDGEVFTEYYTQDNIPKPYLGPFCDPFGNRITRLDFETREHPHHRCLWISHGDIDGTDNWNEGKNHGYILHQSADDIIAGPAFTRFTARNIWATHDKTPQCDEITTFTFYNTPDRCRVFDVDITLTAAYGDFTLGRTKEAGPLAIRMAEAIKVMNTGRMVAGSGGINENEIWMKRAPWLDYYGTENGHVSGIAILDNPANEHHPTYWHSRNYGLTAPNVFFIPGPRMVAGGDSLTFKYRIVTHSGDTQQADIAGKFADYALPVMTMDI